MLESDYLGPWANALVALWRKMKRDASTEPWQQWSEQVASGSWQTTGTGTERWFDIKCKAQRDEAGQNNEEHSSANVFGSVTWNSLNPSNSLPRRQRQAWKRPYEATLLGKLLATCSWLQLLSFDDFDGLFALPNFSQVCIRCIFPCTWSRCLDMLEVAPSDTTKVAEVRVITQSKTSMKTPTFWMFLKHSRGRVCTTSLVRSPISWRWLEYRMRTVLCNCRGCSINGSQVTFRAFSAWAGCTADFYVVLVEWQDMLEKTDSTVGKSQGKWTGKYILFMMLNVVACYCIMCLREMWASPWYVLFWPCIRSVFSATCLALTGMFVAFVSHQWLGITHPDPAGTHTCFLRKALREVLSGSVAVESS